MDVWGNLTPVLKSFPSQQLPQQFIATCSCSALSPPFSVLSQDGEEWEYVPIHSQHIYEYLDSSTFSSAMNFFMALDRSHSLQQVSKGDDPGIDPSIWHTVGAQ